MSNTKKLYIGAYTLAALAAVSGLLGFLRSKVFASYIGVGPELDAYYAAFYLPDLIYFGIVILLSGFSIVPILAKQENAKQIQSVASLSSVFAVLFVVAAALGFIFVDDFLKAFFPAVYWGEYGQEAVFVSRMLFVQGFLLGLSNIFSSFLQLKGAFALLGLSPVFYNLSVILSVFVFYPYFGIVGVSLGVVLGAFVGFLISGGYFVKTILQTKVLPKPTLDFPLFFKVLKQSLPRSSGILAQRISYLVVSSVLSSFAGVLSIFRLANEIIFGAQNVVSNSYSVVSFSLISNLYAKGAFDELKKVLTNSFKSNIFWAVFAGMFLVFFSGEVVEFLGVKNYQSALQMAGFLVFLGLALPFYSIFNICSRALYGMDKVKVVAFANILYATLSAGLGVWLYKISHELSYVGLAYLLASVVVFVVSMIYVKKLVEREVIIELVKAFVAAFLAFKLIVLFKEVLGLQSALMQLVYYAVLGLLLYVAVGYALKLKEPKVFASAAVRVLRNFKK